MKRIQIALLIGMSTFLVACPGMDHHPTEKVKWDDPRILRGTYQGEYGNQNNETFEKLGTLKFEFTPVYTDSYQYKLTGTFQLDSQEEITLNEGWVRMATGEEIVQPQHSPPMPSRMFARAKAEGKVYQFSIWNLAGLKGTLAIYDENTETQLASHAFEISKSK